MNGVSELPEDVVAVSVVMDVPEDVVGVVVVRELPEHVVGVLVEDDSISCSIFDSPTLLGDSEEDMKIVLGGPKETGLGPLMRGGPRLVVNPGRKRRQDFKGERIIPSAIGRG